MSMEGTEASGGDGLGRMLGWVHSLPEQIRSAWTAAAARGGAFPPLGGPGAGTPGPVLLGGMGGSAMAGQIASALLAERLPFPCVVHSGPEAPSWVGPGARALLSSYSGNTDETLALFEACRDRGALLGVMTSGGRLQAEAEAHGVPCFALPGGYAPRAALGWLLAPVWRALFAFAREIAGGECGTGGRGGALIDEDSLLRATGVLDREVALWKSGAALPGRDPAALAEALAGRLVYVLAPSVRRLPVALRWKNQILENAEQAATAVGFPEGGHNEIMGWRHLASLPPMGDTAAPRSGPATASSLARSAAGSVLVLLDDDDGAEGSRRLRVAALAEAGASGLPTVSVPGHGETAVERTLADLLLGDRVSVEMARLRGIDPVPVEAITRFKQAIGKERLA